MTADNFFWTARYVTVVWIMLMIVLQAKGY